MKATRILKHRLQFKVSEHMPFSLIVAMSENNAIGVNGRLPWHLPCDLKHFKQKTLKKPIVMGRTTFESLNKPLPDRTNIILTQQSDYFAQGCVILHSKQDVIDYAQGHDEIMIIGGAKIYQLFFDMITTMYITRVHTEVDADTYFPQWENSQWQEIEREFCPKDEKNEFDCSFMTYKKLAV